jgi:hypothetical protein
MKSPSVPSPAARAEILLTDPSVCLRLQVLRELLARPHDDPEVQELESLRGKDLLALAVLECQDKDGSFRSPGEPRYAEGRLMATSVALARLGFLGFDASFAPVRRCAEWLFRSQRADGSWPLGDPEDEAGQIYSMMPLQTAFPLAGLARAGFARDPRAERAYQWLLDQRLPDGAWPTGRISGVNGFVGGYRRLPHSRWGCRSNTTESLLCLSLHPERRHSAEARQALDHLLARETRERRSLGFEAARLAGLEAARGFLTFHAAFDPALVLELCARIGASMEDQRVSDLAAFIEAGRGELGLWEYLPDPRASAWVSLTIHRALLMLGAGQKRPAGAAWQGLEPRTPFAAYPRKKRRY